MSRPSWVDHSFTGHAFMECALCSGPQAQLCDTARSPPQVWLLWLPGHPYGLGLDALKQFLYAVTWLKEVQGQQEEKGGGLSGR